MGNTFALGDEVVFVPDARTVGWHQHSFQRWGIYPGFRGIVTAIEGDAIVVDGKSEPAISAGQFRLGSEVSVEESERLKRAWAVHRER